MDSSSRFYLISIKNSLVLSGNEKKLLNDYVRALLSWNKKINLISRRDEENIWMKHILGSLSFLFRFRLHTKSSLCDVGTGGGLPGIPIAILHPDLHIVLIDSIQKKIMTTNDIISTIGLRNVTTIQGRVEELTQKKEHLRAFDYVIARGVAPISQIVQWCSGLLKQPADARAHVQKATSSKPAIPTGTILLLKGGDLAQEIDEAYQKLKIKKIEVHDLIVQDVDPVDYAGKKIVIIQP